MSGLGMALTGKLPMRVASKSIAATIAVLVGYAIASASASAAPNRSCGSVTTPRGIVSVKTFGAGGPTCAVARSVVRATYRRPYRYRWNGYRCHSGPKSAGILWTCNYRKGSRNVLVYR